LFSSQLFKSKIEKEAASFASSRKISVSVAKTILMKSKWNTATASKLLSNSKYGDKLIRSRKSHCDGKSENFWTRQSILKKTGLETDFPAQNLDGLQERSRQISDRKAEQG
jgi:hypothetical protein